MSQFLKYRLWDCFISCFKYQLVALLKSYLSTKYQDLHIPAYLDIEWALVGGMSHLPDCLVEYF